MRTTTGLALVAVASVGCGPGQMVKPEEPEGDAGTLDLGDGGVRCTAELEAAMVTALANAPHG